MIEWCDLHTVHNFHNIYRSPMPTDAKDASSSSTPKVMLLRSMPCSRRSLTWLLTMNLIGLAIVILVMFDTYHNQHKSFYEDAYDRWVDIRGDFESYKKKRFKAEMKWSGKGRQLDKVVGFDFINNERLNLDEEPEKTRRKSPTYNYGDILDFIPPVPKFSDIDVVPELASNITRQYLKLPRKKYTRKIVILSPVCNVAHQLDRFVKLLNNLSYPHHLMSVYFGEDSSDDRTLTMAKLIANELKTEYRFRDAAAFHFNLSGGVHGSWGDTHDRSSQHERRAHLAKARNLLLEVGLHSTESDYVLWIDSDITTLPRDLVQQLLYAKSDVAAATCLYKSGKHRRIFDKNSWRETPKSLEDQSHLDTDVLLVEGYANTYRIYLSDLRAEGRVVPLDGVGGCALMIKTLCHEKGLVFPDYIYRNHIETEGLAKMAKDMGFKVVGLPFVEVFH